MKIDKIFHSPATNKRRNEIISQKLANMISEDLLPLSFVEGNGFKKFMQVLDPNFTVPSRNTILTRIKLHYEECKKIILNKLQEIDHVALTTDCWSSRSNKSFLTLTVHAINKEWDLISYNLSTKLMSEKHTYYNLQEKINEIIQEWNITGKVVATVHDNAANIKKAILTDELNRFGSSVCCFAHSLQLGINKGLEKQKSINSIIIKCSQIVGHFSHSNLANEALTKAQQVLNLPQHKLIQSVKTRWNSVYYMMERLLEQKLAILHVLNDRTVTLRKIALDLIIQEEEWNNIEEIVNILKPFELATTFMSSEKQPTASIIQPLSISFKNNFLKINQNDNEFISEFKYIVRQDFQERYEILGDDSDEIAPSSVYDRYDNVTILDKCNFFDLRYRNKERRFGIFHKIKNQIEAELLMYQDEQEEFVSKSNDIIDVLFPDEPTDKQISEIDAYLKEIPINKSSNILLWWKNNSIRYPKLSKLAKKYLCIPATSTPSERVFSSAGNIITAKRNCLEAKNAEILIFLHHNKL